MSGAEPLPAAELQALAAARPLRTRELHPFNAFYGHDLILKRYAGLDARRPLKAAIEHGLTLERTVSRIDRRLRLPLHLTQSPARADLLQRELPNTEAVPIGPLILYAEGLAPTVAPPTRRRVVLFPAHSAAGVRAEFAIDELLARTAGYRAGFDETVACLYWRDVELGRNRGYERAGVGCTTAGHMFDPAFLFRLLGILRDAAAVVTNEVGTHVAYAVLLGVPVWIVPQQVDYRLSAATSADQRASIEAQVAGAETALLERLFAEAVSSPTEEQRAAVHDLTGTGAMRSPEELRTLLERAEQAYRRRPLPHRMRVRAESFARRLGG